MRLVLIDGHAILHRAFHAYPPLTTPKGELVGAVYGFTSILLTVLQKLKPEYVAVAFDKKGPTFRHKKFAAYKIKRKPMDQGLIGQLPRVHEVVEVLNIPIFELEGFEGDDVIGTLAHQAALVGQDSSQPLEIVIVTGDQDALQLVTDQVKVYMPSHGKQPEQIYGPDQVKQKYGLVPSQIIDLKALAGDASDGIPGVKGIGPKTTKDLLVKFGTLEEIYKHLNNLVPKIKDKLQKEKETAFLSQELATIDTKAPIELKLSCCQLTDYNKDKVINLFETLGFKSLLKKLPKEEKLEAKQMGLF